MSDALVNLVRGAYEPVVVDRLRRSPSLPPLTEKQRARLAALRLEEDERRVTLMERHQPVAGTTDVCRCGNVGYSTPGYLLHLYEVVEDDVTGGMG